MGALNNNFVNTHSIPEFNMHQHMTLQAVTPLLFLISYKVNTILFRALVCTTT